MRRRRIIMFFAMIMSMAIIGVGFAAWIITAPTTEVYEDGSINVETVEMQGWTFKKYWVDSKDYVKADGDSGKLVDLSGTDKNESKPTIKYGPKGEKGNGWLSNNTSGFEENLVAYLYVEGNKINDGQYQIEDNATVSLDFIKNSAVYDESNYSAYVGVSLSQETLTAQELRDGKVITITFSWKTPQLVMGENNLATGEETGEGATKNVNPYAYYNTFKYNELVSETALEYLAAVQTALVGVSFKVTLTAVPKTA